MKKITLRADFDEVMSSGVYANTAHFAIHKQKSLEIARIGAVVPKRWAKKAVTRNAIKRQIYAYANESSNTLATASFVVRLKKTFPKTEFISACSNVLKKEIRNEIQELFKKAMAHP